MNVLHSRRALAVVSLLASATFVAARSRSAAEPAVATPPIKHVFVIMLENEGFDTTFAPTTRATYLADTLVKQGALLRQYFGIGHYSLDNYIAMISGMPATAATQMDCPKFIDFVQTGTSPDGQPIGTGCVYPASVKTIANQLDARALTWRGYMEDMGSDTTREAATCGHPAIGATDSTEWATKVDQYATKHNPFMYFHAVIDSPSCKRRIVPLAALTQDLRSASTTPNFSYITPNLCHDGHDHPCVDGEPGGLESANLFLQHWVPIIMKSPAFRNDGLLIITFDEALSIDRSSCCGQVAGPNARVASDGQFGGGRIGAVLLSRFIAPGTVSDVPYNHYSFLKSLEDIFGVSHLGYARQATVSSFGDDVFGSGASPASAKAP
jgi:phosphatidylinositol-3-phosphatase